MKRVTDSAEVMAIVERIRPLLKGKPPNVQGAVLAELLANFIHGHFAFRDPAGTQRVRDEILEMHCGVVRDLVAVADGKKL